MIKNYLLMILIVFTACTPSKKREITMPYKDADFKKEINGKETALFTLENSNGMIVKLTNYGAKIVSVYAPDKNGNFNDVVLGFKSIGEYQQNGASHGAVVGPYANRIGNAEFTIEGVNYSLPVNNGAACLHSGPNSWYRKVWDAKKEPNKIIFTLHDNDGDYGFPGNKTVMVTYSLNNENELRIDYAVTTDKPCFVNVTNHSYFNLRGEGNGDILDHIIVINAGKSTPVNSEMIPTGDIISLAGTDLDFSTPHAIGERIDNNDSLLMFAAGYDFNYIIDKQPGELAFAASAYEPESGRYMEVFTTEPGLQFYTGNHLKGNETGKSGTAYTKRTGFCLETQHFPDSPNHPEFPSTLLTPGETLESTTIYKFSVKNI